MSSDPRILNVFKGDVLESLNTPGTFSVIVDRSVDGTVTYDRYVRNRFNRRIGPTRPGWIAEHWRKMSRDEAVAWTVMAS